MKYRTFLCPLIGRVHIKRQSMSENVTHRWLYVKKSNTPNWKVLILILGFRSLREAVWLQSAKVSCRIYDPLAPQIPNQVTLHSVLDGMNWYQQWLREALLFNGWEKAGLVIIFLEKFSVSPCSPRSVLQCHSQPTFRISFKKNWSGIM